ncbi:MAG: FAD-dependent oxidoreductase [Phycisphaerales bacterium]|nr:FAD-dependent oxidoreductase [Phycisphaerales bacterium]
MPDRSIVADVLIFGGGIAGLWTLARLAQGGRTAILLESAALGAGQTIASQGIIHGGVKYALGGSVGDASRAIAAMPDLWRACLEGRGPIDLSRVRVLSESQFLWTGKGLGSRLMGLAASRTLRAGVTTLPPERRPDGFRAAPPSVAVYGVPEPVLEPRSLVEALAAPHERLCLRSEPGAVSFEASAGALRAAEVGVGAERWRIEAGLIAFCAGEGNEALLEQAAAALGAPAPPPPPMQRRPLHMVLARERTEGVLPPMYAHAVGMASGPLATVTSQRDASGRRVWWIGGGLAESGVERGAVEQAKHALEQMASLAPWIDWSVVDWATVRINRAESRTDSGRRPDGPAIEDWAGSVVCWPSKLAFAPVVADAIAERAERVPSAHIRPDIPADAPIAPVARLPWEREDLQWL